MTANIYSTGFTYTFVMDIFDNIDDIVKREIRNKKLKSIMKDNFLDIYKNLHGDLKPDMEFSEKYKYV